MLSLSLVLKSEPKILCLVKFCNMNCETQRYDVQHQGLIEEGDIVKISTRLGVDQVKPKKWYWIYF